MGEVFAGRYELIDLIGEGGMGTIWIALDRKTDGLVAAKVLRQSDAAGLLRFVREQSVRIHDPNVLTPLGWAGEDDRVLFTMPIVRGGSVATLVGDHGPLPPLLVAELTRQILGGLAAVHAAGLVHRDIKPANILLDATGTDRPHAYISDFGIALDLTAPRWTETGLISGTPGYLAPELESAGTISTRTDLYAVGQVALTMLTSQRPSHRGLGGPSLDRTEDCSKVLWSVISDLVAQDPEARPESARAALDRLLVPELSWREGAMGEVEIFEHVAADGREVTRLTTNRRTPGESGPLVVDDVAEEPRGSRATAERAGVRESDEPRGSGRTSAVMTGAGGPRPTLVAAGLGAVALIGLLLIWSPWERTGAHAGDITSPSPSRSASASTSPSAAPSPSVTKGSVSVGRVVQSVGQTCEFVDVGLRETTVNGVGVSCQLQSDGSYAWLVP